MAVATVDAQFHIMVFVAERHRLCERIPDIGVEGGPGYGAADQQRRKRTDDSKDEDAESGDGIGRRMEYLSHRHAPYGTDFRNR